MTAQGPLGHSAMSTRCPLWIALRTQVGHFPTTEKCQERTHAPQQIVSLFDHLVGSAQQRNWKSEAKRLGGLEIDDQLDFSGLLHRQVGRLLALEDAASIAPRPTVCVEN